MVQVPTPSLENIMYLLLGILIGLPAPYWYAQERIQGFIRAMLDKMPYRPPPGMNKEEALREAVEADDGAGEEGQGGQDD